MDQGREDGTRGLHHQGVQVNGIIKWDYHPDYHEITVSSKKRCMTQIDDDIGYIDQKEYELLYVFYFWIIPPKIILKVGNQENIERPMFQRQYVNRR